MIRNGMLLHLRTRKTRVRRVFGGFFAGETQSFVLVYGKICRYLGRLAHLVRARS